MMQQKLCNEVRREGVKVESFGKREGKLDDRFSPPTSSPRSLSFSLQGDSEQLLHSDTEPQPFKGGEERKRWRKIRKKSRREKRSRRRMRRLWRRNRKMRNKREKSRC